MEAPFEHGGVHVTEEQGAARRGERECLADDVEQMAVVGKCWTTELSTTVSKWPAGSSPTMRAEAYRSRTRPASAGWSRGRSSSSATARAE
ncbi:hypothetical protein B9W68_00720 [Streptomyces sp. CS227]|nr:hypothetical protein B9W68_00720 [Streptomyces sp. CS227]